MHVIPEATAMATIRALAEQHHVRYVETQADILGHHITRLAGDDVELDDTQLLLIALERAGRISGREAVRLHVAYLNEARPYRHQEAGAWCAAVCERLLARIAAVTRRRTEPRAKGTETATEGYGRGWI